MAFRLADRFIPQSASTFTTSNTTITENTSPTIIVDSTAGVVSVELPSAALHTSKLPITIKKSKVNGKHLNSVVIRGKTSTTDQIVTPWTVDTFANFNTAGTTGISLNIPGEYVVLIPYYNTTYTKYFWIALDYFAPQTDFCLATRTGTVQTVGTGAFTTIELNSDSGGGTSGYDYFSNFDSTTNYRFTPQVVGTYEISGAVTFGGGGTSYGAIGLYKNGSAPTDRVDFGAETGVTTGNLFRFKLDTSKVYMNGSTDWLDMKVYLNSNSRSVSLTTANTYFKARFISKENIV